jgi:glucose/mannose-6-phosphate isomerase
MDKYNLREVILNYPLQLELGQKFAENIELPQKEFSNLIICGMGGSALAGDFLINYFDTNGKVDLPIYICRSYELPEDATSNSLIFVVSYSGNTEETVSCFQKAIRINSTLVAFSSGGKIKEMAIEKNLPFVELSFNFKHFEPRYAAPYIFMAMHQILANQGITKKIDSLPKISPSDSEALGKKIALELVGKTPVICASDKYGLLAKNWKIKINENAKTPAFWNFFPELNHNEMVGFTLPQANFYVLMLMEKDDHPRNKKRMEITAELYKEKGVESKIIPIEGGDFMEKLLNTLVLGDWVSYYLALEYGQDPTPVKMVEDLKNILK